MTVRSRLGVSTLCGLSLLCTVAHAGGPWRMWVHNGEWHLSARESREWRLIMSDIFATEHECRAAALREARWRYIGESRRAHAHRGNVELSGAEVHVPLEFGDEVIISYECYPETVDPRERR